MPEAARMSSRSLLPEASYPQFPPFSINSLTQALQSRQAKQLHGMNIGKNSGKMSPGNSPFVGIYMCFFCSKEFVNKKDMRKHQLTCTKKPPDIQSVDQTSKNNRRRAVKSADLHLFIPQLTVSVDQFMQKLNLVPLSKVKKLRESSRKSTEVNTIDFSDPEVPISPTTPKTPKLLITQLSRDQDIHSCKRRLSYMSQKENISDTESIVSNENEEHEGRRHVKKAISLFSIPVSSVLGGRVLKHMMSDSTTHHVLTNTEEFCKTPKKNKFVDRLRVRDNAFLITYKPRWRYRFQHSYKFSKAQRKEFMRNINCGLNTRSRKLRNSLPKCTVQLTRLTSQQIKKYQRLHKKHARSLNPTVSVKKLNENYFFPKKPILLTHNIDKVLGLRKKRQPAKLSPMNVVSENTNVELLKQKVAVYRSLLTDLSMSTAKQKLKFVKNASQLNSKSDRESAPNVVAHRYLQVQKSLNSAVKKKNANSFSLKHQFPQLSDILKQNPMTSCASPPSSVESSPESLKSLKRPLKIDIPSEDSSLSHFLLGSDADKQLRAEHSSPDSVSIRTLSSDDDSWREQCCMGCQLRKQCGCTPCQGIDEADEVEKSEDVVKSKQCTPNKNQLSNSSTANSLFPQNVCPDTLLNSPKENVLKESSVHIGDQAKHVGSLSPTGQKMQTRSSISSCPGGAVGAPTPTPCIKTEKSVTDASNLYSLRSNPSANVLTDSSNQNFKSFKNSVKESSVSVLSRIQPLDKSQLNLLQRSLSTDLADQETSDNVGASRSLRSGLSSQSSRHLSVCDLPSRIVSRPTRNSLAKVLHSSATSSDTSSMSDISKSSALKSKNQHMVKRSRCLKDVRESNGEKWESGVFVSDCQTGGSTRSLRLPAVRNSRSESDENVDDDLDIGGQFTRVDADILLKNVKNVNGPADILLKNVKNVNGPAYQCKQKPLSDSQTVNNSPRLRKRAATWTQSSVESHGVALKRKRLDL